MIINESKLKKAYLWLGILAWIFSSYPVIVKNNYIDDIFVMIIGLVEAIDVLMIRRKKYSITIVAALILFFFIETFFSLFVLKDIVNTYTSAIVFLKMMIVLMLPMLINLSNDDVYKILKIYFWIEIPNYIFATYQFFLSYILHVKIVGKFENSELSGGVFLLRLSGLTEHPIYFSLIALFGIIYLLYFVNGLWRFFVIAWCSFLLTLSFTTGIIVMGAAVALYYIALKLRSVNGNRYLQYLLLTLGFIGYVFLTYKVLINETNTIRFISIISTLKNLNFLNIIAGNGIGAYLIDGYKEAYLFHVLYEQGLCGVFLLLFPMLHYLFVQQKNRNYGGVVYILTFILNSIINEGYAAPYIFAIFSITYLGEQKFNSDMIK